MNDESMVKSVCMDADDIERAVTRMAHQILEANKGAENLALVGIVTRGDLLAKMLVHKIEEIEGVKVPLGKLDISFYRDDFATHMSPEVHSTDIPFSIDGMTIVLVDDVLYTGRTIRAALDALMDIGPPRRRGAGGPRRPRPSRAAHPRRLRGQERAVGLRRERAPLPGGDGRASPRSRFWKSHRVPARARRRWEVNRAWPSTTST